jgi:hypothetical protein
MALEKFCNICRKELSEEEKEAAKRESLPAVCSEHLIYIKKQIPKCVELFQKANLC